MWLITSWFLFGAALGWAGWFVGRRVWRRRRYRRYCESCGYDLRGGAASRCPECGHDTSRPMRLIRFRRALLHSMMVFALLTASHLVYRVEAIQKRGWIAAVPTTVLIALLAPEEPDPGLPFGPRSPLLGELGYRAELRFLPRVPVLQSAGDGVMHWQELWLVRKALRVKYGPQLGAPDWQVPAVGILRSAYERGLLTDQQMRRLEDSWYVHVETRSAWTLGTTVTARFHPQLAIFNDGYRLTAHALTPGFQDDVESHRTIDSILFVPSSRSIGVAEQVGPVEYEFIMERYHYPASTWEEIGRQTQVITTVSASSDHGLTACELPAELIATLNPRLRQLPSGEAEVWFDMDADPKFGMALGSATFAITLTLYCDGEQGGSGSGTWIPPDRPAGIWDPSQYISPVASPPWQVPVTITSQPTPPAIPTVHRWTLVIEGDPAGALADIDSTSYWSGRHEFTDIVVESDGP